MNTVIVKQGDTAPVPLHVSDGDGKPFNLTGCQARLLVGRTGRVVQSFPLVIVDAAAGDLEWSPDGTLTPVGYSAEVEVTRPDGTIATFPSDGYLNLRVVAQLG